jgi:DNA-binding response OmpR family regulator
MRLLLLTNDRHDESVLPALVLLTHRVLCAPAEVSSLSNAHAVEAVIVDARTDLVAARGLCQVLDAEAKSVPVVAVVAEGGLIAVDPRWAIDEILLPGAGAAEIDVRLRLLVGRRSGIDRRDDIDTISLGVLTMNMGTHTARLQGRPILLTYTEFELLKYLTQHPGRVFTRQQLLDEVWGYDYFGGTRTVDVHIRRLRSKLGDHQSLIGTVRNLGYRAMRRNAGISLPDSDRSRHGVPDPTCAPPSPSAATTPAPPPQTAA